eukprot:TRINITY_DN10701_c0_g1_i11.p1 TRINITY_DN10701_c0_g1~~TRINITY_DN10701_c0_g1_i11.p1  ORF type:complete len:138 (+),score=31.38 TRINITY_DN10701_c0_g1_i11:75-488(+)
MCIRDRYKNRIVMLKGIVSKVDEVGDSIKEVVNDCKSEQGVIEIRKRIFEDVRKAERDKTRRIELEKEKVDRILLKAVKELENFNEKFEEDEAANKELIRRIGKEDQIVVDDIHNMLELSITFVAKYSEKGKRRKCS